MFRKIIVLLFIILVICSPFIFMFFKWGFPIPEEAVGTNLFLVVAFFGILVSSYGGWILGLFLKLTILS